MVPTRMTKVLIVIDYQNDLVIGPLGFDRAKGLEAPILRKLEQFWNGGEMIVFTKDVHDADPYRPSDADTGIRPIHCVDETGSAIYGEVAKYCHEGNTVVKRCFGSEDLCARFYFYEGLESFELVGISGSTSVLSNAVLLKANYPDIRVVVDAECVASPDDSMNEKALDIMENLRIEVINRHQN